MGEHRVRKRREVEVVAEELLGRHGVQDLNERAAWTEGKVQRESLLPLVDLLPREERVCKRDRSEREDQLEVVVSAGSTGRGSGNVQGLSPPLLKGRCLRIALREHCDWQGPAD